MKKRFLCFLSVIMAVVMTVAAIPLTASAKQGNGGDALILIDGATAAKVYIDTDATETEEYAAQTLCRYIGQVTGVTPETVCGKPDETAPYIAIGDCGFTGADKPADDGYIISTAENGVNITHGDGNRGALRGVYRFLEEFCGCHFYASDCTVIPEIEIISVPTDTLISYKPFFEYGECDTMSARNAEFCVANGTSGGVYCQIPDYMGGTVRYISGFCHTLTSQYCASWKYFDEHPEYFALHDGERNSTQLCLTNPDVIEIVKREVAQTIADNYDPDGGLQIISVTQNDNVNYCECDRCRAIDEQNGSQAGTMVTFANEIAKSVKQYRNIAIDTFAYQYTRHTPTQVVPDDNVIIRLCSIECCFGHTLDDENCDWNTAFMEDLKNWGRICDRIYIWDYVTNYAETICVFPNFGVLQSNMQTFYENGVKGIYEEGNYYIESCDAEFGELRTYLLSRLMRDPYCDYDAEMNGYLKAYYGDGWEAIREFIDITTKRAVTKKQHLPIYQSSSACLPGITPYEIYKCNKLWKQAKALAGNETQLNRVRRSELSWRYWKAVNEKCEFSQLLPITKWTGENKKLRADFEEFGITTRGEDFQGTRKLTETEDLYTYFTPNCWYIGFEHVLTRKSDITRIKFYKIMEMFCKLFRPVFPAC